MYFEVNPLSILLAAIASMVLGFIWYGPTAFGHLWMKERGLTAESMKKFPKQMKNLYTVSFLVSLVTAFVLASFMLLSQNLTGYPALTTSILVSGLAWLGFVFPTLLSNTIFTTQNWKLLAIDSGYQLASLLTMGVIISLFWV